MAKLRRLFDMRIKHVSLVDKAANKRRFLIVKRDEGGKNMEELQEVLSKVENAINDLGEKISAVEKKIDERDEKEVVFKFDVDKAGAKFSKDTIGKLTSLRNALNSLLGDISAGTDEKASVSKEDKENIADALASKMMEEHESSKDKGDE